MNGCAVVSDFPKFVVKMGGFSKILVVSTAVFAASADDCSVDSSEKVDCGYSTIQEDECEDKGCCWQAVDGDPYCFYKAGMAYPTPAPTKTPVSCFSAAEEAQEPFSSDEVNTMRTYFLANVNIEGDGTVVAGFNDASAVGGSYYYHWERDGAKTMRALQETSSASNVSDYMLSYTNWVIQAQNFEDPNGIDVRIEPKYYLPDGGVFEDGWCRPQNDGPGLRAISLMIYANSLGTVSDIVKNLLWTGDDNVNNGGAIKHDLDWVVDGYDTNTCDLWEEVQSSDFFWNKVTMKKALYEGVLFAKSMGDEDTAATYQSTLNTINATLFDDHWTEDGNYVYESTNRMKDGAVIVGFNDGYIAEDGMYAPTSAEVAATIKNYNMEFCHEWNINTIDTANGLPGVLYGRYPGDTYAGGNPWVLSTSALGNLFYRGAIQIANEGMPSSDAQTIWSEVFFGTDTEFPLTAADAADLFFRAGDGIMLRLRSHVEADGFHLAEQIDRETGEQESAQDLTWSYAETLSAMASRDAYLAL